MLIYSIERVEELNKKCIEKYDQFDSKPWIARLILKRNIEHNLKALCQKVAENIMGC